jgi:hypothetical protein
MLIDIESAFLQEKDFEEIRAACPREEHWKQAVVHHRRTGRDVVDNSTRKADKCVEMRHDFIEKAQRMVVRALLPHLRKSPQFLHCWARGHRGTEWLRYKPGMFFRPHTDFERYVCGGLVPYVCLIGMKDVEEGGETRVGETMCVGGARRNGAVFFPATELHEARSVVNGEKLCLKMEFFVVTAAPDVLRVEDAGRRWMSAWSKETIGLFDNYLRSHSSFEKRADANRLAVTTETAQELQQIMMAIAEARTRECEMFFPTLSTTFLHDVFACQHYLSHPDPTTVILGSDERAWDYMNTEMSLPPTSRLMMGLWYRKTTEDGYRLHNAFSRLGQLTKSFHPFFQSATTVDTIDTATHQYYPYSILHKHVLEEFIYAQDLSTDGFRPIMDAEEQKLEGKDLPLTTRLIKWKHILKNVQPSDRIQKKIRKSGMARTTVTEMCNDEDLGTTTESYETYVSFDIQIRWFLHIQ